MFGHTDENYMKNIFLRRKRDAHKGDFGRILIFAGSFGMAGAAVMCGRASLRTGAGLTRFLLTEGNASICPVLQAAVPEATCTFYYPGSDLSEYSAICAGPGLGSDDKTQAALADIISSFSGNLILDADALNMIARSDKLKEALSGSSASLVMTPHIGEARRLLGRNDPIRSQEEREAALLELSSGYNAIVVLKGSGTLVGRNGDDENYVYLNETGNPGMATGGSGDVLTGIIGSLSAQGYCALDSARTGVFIHGMAGDLAAEALGEMSLTASDIIDYIPAALKKYYPAE